MPHSVPRQNENPARFPGAGSREPSCTGLGRLLEGSVRETHGARQRFLTEHPARTWGHFCPLDHSRTLPQGDGRGGPARHGCPVGRFGYFEVVHASDVLDNAVACVVPDVHAEGKTFAQDAQLKSIAACRTVARRLNLEEERFTAGASPFRTAHRCFGQAAKALLRP
jgi:hypothetical protein